MDGDRVKFEELVDSGNWIYWKFQMKAFLNARDALEVIDGTWVKPDNSVEKAVELARWKKPNKIAKEVLVTTLDKKTLTLIMNCDTTCEMWFKLLNICEKKSADAVYLLQTISCLKELDEEISDTMLMTTILNTLPSEFRHFHSAWDSTSAEGRTLDKLVSRLMVEEVKLGMSEIKMNPESALVVKKEIKTKSFGLKPISNSHKVKTKLKCWTILNEKDTFVLGNGSTVVAVGSDKIRIKSNVDDGEHYLDNVMYVPDMKVNLFLVRSVAENGFKQTILRKKWTFKENNVLIVEGHRGNNVYILDIDVIQNRQLSLSAQSSKENSL
ncbi:uncharacterized protein LOC128882724 [Hylaeus volcanicus]|uniref:uncharacterized protein LOC128882724 n=1 Tax=Hylaeus volcanicus TaxID=313075 RepID=UPI0023B7B60F|nr:uncharacterized protein LOC128882724 [Hylaeus volcanicus]